MFKKHIFKYFKECHFQDFGNLDSSCLSSFSLLFQISWTEKLTSAILLFQDKSCSSNHHLSPINLIKGKKNKTKQNTQQITEQKNYAENSKTSSTDS